jgi:putative component of toxin-antitoxin plasmid stabilization module
MMTVTEIQTRVDRAVSQMAKWLDWFRKNRIEPQRVEVFSDLSQTGKTTVWVLTRHEGNSYRIYYDPEEDMFGLTVLLMGGGECLMGLSDCSLDETIENM